MLNDTWDFPAEALGKAGEQENIHQFMLTWNITSLLHIGLELRRLIAKKKFSEVCDIYEASK